MAALMISVVVLYVTIIVLGIRAGVETYAENRRNAQWYSRMTEELDNQLSSPASAKKAKGA